MENIIVREYIESLNESKELDYIFPMLLESMGMRVISTPKNSKGQSQYGKDVVAVGKDENGIQCRYYFELKGFFAKNINDKTFMDQDGFRDSIIAAKDTAFQDSSISKFNDLPVRIVFVHNGILIENTRPTFEGFINREFPNGGFERWDIYKLTELFSEHLFNEYLLTDPECVRLFKRVLVLLDAPDNAYLDLKKLVTIQLNKIVKVNLKTQGGNREILNLFASLKLLIVVIYKYAKENDNIYPAKECVDYIVLNAWGWILMNHIENAKKICNLFNGLVIIQRHVYNDYFLKTILLAQYPKGLYSFTPSIAEVICYPLRCLDYLNDLIYFYNMTNAYVSAERYTELIVEQKKIIKSIVESNSGCTTVLLDNHSITIHLVLDFMLRNSPNESDEQFCADYIYKLVYGLILMYRRNNRLPELHSNRIELARSYYTKTDSYCDKSSLLLLFLFEILSHFDANELYLQLKEIVEDSGVNLQVAYPKSNVDIEQLLFSKTLNNEISVETSIKLPKTLAEFRQDFKKRYNSIIYRTDKTGYGFLRLLAHIYYKSDFFPDQLNFGFCIPMDTKANNSILLQRQ